MIPDQNQLIPLSAAVQAGIVPEFRARLDAAARDAIQRTSVDVFVMGPSSNGAPEDRAANLRLELIELGKTIGFSAKAEHPEIASAMPALGPDANLCLMELTYAATCDLVVIIPSSHGAAGEIGYFAGMTTYARKLNHLRWLIFLDQEYAARPGFVWNGPVKVLEQAGARVEVIDLDNVDYARQVLTDVVWETRQRKLHRVVADG